MAGEGFEPSKAEPTDLQSVPFDRSGTPPEAVRSVAAARAPRGGEDPGAAAPRATPAPYDASRSRCVSGSDSSFLSVWFSIWRMRSRVTLKAWPTSSSVRGRSPVSP